MRNQFKQRSKLGHWLDERGISQEWLVNKSGCSRNTISKLASGTNDYLPSLRTVNKITDALRNIDKDVKAGDLFDV